ncbi:malate synthase, glyoxysomal [Zea mays]|uniref:Malate synthase, glyoxysomal n=1 Tax=Zea mays TaxID=4577 RepID=MASY_MAIZE|nr:malate synthase, glyoxysomal [Zea mays]P49081.1 RecName: Full=Malate synthase, glyoxysomal [Zea mays]AAB04118.1 malate synthase [Zea mays]|eukprot:NP_001105328.1 malate synthase, glyoxysomal [Zea mays]
MAASTAAPCYDAPEGVDVRGRYDREFAGILTRDALDFVAGLQREFRGAVRYAMEQRREAQRRYDAGELPRFDPATTLVREGDWTCASVPPAVADRTVEITGPAEPRKMVINALNSGAKVFMADFEDAMSPTWENLMHGQVNLRDAVAGTISFRDAPRGRTYELNDRTAKLFVRPRGWHLPEAHILIDGEPAIGCLVDFGLYFFHNHAAFGAGQGAGFGPLCDLPKMEHSREARIWNGVFQRAEKAAGIEPGSIRATVLVETLPAVFQMNEILHELREHSAGLNCGRWDYIFSYVKTFRAHPDRLLPDRALVGMAQHFMRSYSHLLIHTCHRRGVHAMGGMAAQIPIKDDAAANEAALELVRKDKLREVRAGHDGTWAAHPGLIPAIREVFEGHLGGRPNQIGDAAGHEGASVKEEDLIQPPRGARTVDGLRLNVRVGVQYLAAWLAGSGSVPLYNLMEDAATAEISRVQNWQWLRHGAALDAGGVEVRATPELLARVVEEEMARVEAEVGPDRFRKGRYAEAGRIFSRQCTAPELDDFLTLDAYNLIVAHHPGASPCKL